MSDQDPIPDFPKGTWTEVPAHAARPSGLISNLAKLRELLQVQLSEAQRKLEDAKMMRRRGGR